MNESIMLDVDRGVVEQRIIVPRKLRNNETAILGAYEASGWLGVPADPDYLF